MRIFPFNRPLNCHIRQCIMTISTVDQFDTFCRLFFYCVLNNAARKYWEKARTLLRRPGESCTVLYIKVESNSLRIDYCSMFSRAVIMRTTCRWLFKSQASSSNYILHTLALEVYAIRYHFDQRDAELFPGLVRMCIGRFFAHSTIEPCEC